MAAQTSKDDDGDADTSRRNLSPASSVLRSALYHLRPKFYQAKSLNSTVDVDPKQLEAGRAHQCAPMSQVSGTEAVGQENENLGSKPLTMNPADNHRVEDFHTGHAHQDNQTVLSTSNANQHHQSLRSKFINWTQRDKRAKESTLPRSPHSGSAKDEDSIFNYEESRQTYKVGGSVDAPDDNIQRPPEYTEEANTLWQTFSLGNGNSGSLETRFGTHAPSVDRYIPNLDYVSPPGEYKRGILGAMLASKLYDLQRETLQQRAYRSNDTQHADYLSASRNYVFGHQTSRSLDSLALTSGTTTPTKKVKWYEKPEASDSMISILAHAGMSSTSPGMPAVSGTLPLPNISRLKPSNMISKAVDIISKGGAHDRKSNAWPMDHENDVVAEVADIIARRKYLAKLCSTFMKYGAPTHRLEEYLSASARALSIDAEFMYIPGAMMCTFADPTTHTKDVELVREKAGLDFGRLNDVFDVYKCVIHEKFTAQEGIMEIDNIEKRPNIHGDAFRIFIFGLASVVVGPFSFSSRPIDFGPIFILGCLLGYMQLKVVPRSEQFSNVFEIFACVLAAFIARGLGSIQWPGSRDYVFCFSATAQSSIAMILPGFMVLNSALELQSRNIVSGSVRMVYAIIYVLFLGFGLLVGTTIFGLIKRDAVDDLTCKVPDWFSPADNNWKLIHTRFVWAPLFACCLAITYQAKWRQLPIMALIAFCGHQANFWISTQLSSNLQVANAIGAFVIGCVANLYSRLFHGLAAAAMLPAIYCQVPGGLAASGSLVAGIKSSNQIIGNSSSITVINNGTQGFVQAQDDPNTVYGGTIFNTGYGMIQVAIGISVGLYLSSLVVYPFGKRRSGLFSF